jgi:hypothetical protein
LAFLDEADSGIDDKHESAAPLNTLLPTDAILSSRMSFSTATPDFNSQQFLLT